MEAIELLEKVIYEESVDERQEIINAFIRANTLTKRVGKLNLYNFIDKSKYIKSLSGVYYDPYGFKVVSDGHALLAIKEDFDKDLAGKIIDKKGGEIDCKYPNWKGVIPTGEMEASYTTSEIPFDRIKEAYKHYTAAKKLIKNARDKKSYLEYIKIEKTYYKVQNIYDMLPFFKEFGITEMKSDTSKDKPRAATFRNGETVGILMPVIITDEEECTIIIHK